MSYECNVTKTKKVKRREKRKSERRRERMQSLRVSTEEWWLIIYKMIKNYKSESIYKKRNKRDRRYLTKNTRRVLQMQYGRVYMEETGQNSEMSQQMNSE